MQLTRWPQKPPLLSPLRLHRPHLSNTPPPRLTVNLQGPPNPLNPLASKHSPLISTSPRLSNYLRKKLNIYGASGTPRIRVLCAPLFPTQRTSASKPPLGATHNSSSLYPVRGKVPRYTFSSGLSLPRLHPQSFSRILPSSSHEESTRNHIRL